MTASNGPISSKFSNETRRKTSPGGASGSIATTSYRAAAKARASSPLPHPISRMRPGGGRRRASTNGAKSIVRLKLAVKVVICDVGPRDGLQNESAVLEPAVRADLVNRLAASGLRRIEAASFVNPERVPQMAGAEEVVGGIERRDGVAYAGLVLNEKGAERFAATQLDRLHFTLAATETFNQRNANASIADSLATLARLETARPVSVSISVSFGCPFEGAVDPETVLEIATKAAESGAEEV